MKRRSWLSGSPLPHVPASNCAQSEPNAWAARSALERDFLGIQTQLALGLLRSVTLDAGLLKDGLNVIDEINLAFRPGFPRAEGQQPGRDQNCFVHVHHLHQEGLLGNAQMNAGPERACGCAQPGCKLQA